MKLTLTAPSDKARAAFDMAVAQIEGDPRFIQRMGKVFFFSAEPGGEGVGLFEVSFFNDKLHLSGLHAIDGQRGKGYGSMLLQIALDAADAARIPIILMAQPFGQEKRLSAKQLEAWYRRHGFMPRTGHSREVMVRRVGRSRGMTFEAARDLAARHGGIVRPFEKDRLNDNETISWGVTDPDNLVVPIPDTPAWWNYRTRFFHDLLLEKEAEA